MTTVRAGLRVWSMDKEELKSRLLQAVRADGHFSQMRRVAVFGSCIREEMSPDSDVDVLIEFVPRAGIGYFELFDIQKHFESFVGRRVDLLTPRSLSKYFRDDVLAEAEYVYERR